VLCAPLLIHGLQKAQKSYQLSACVSKSVATVPAFAGIAQVLKWGYLLTRRYVGYIAHIVKHMVRGPSASLGNLLLSSLCVLG
jgi:hypothetical protein